METPEKNSSNYDVSYFTNVSSLYPTQISLIHFLHTIKSCIYEYRIQLIRNETDKQARNIIKSSLPAICASALFDGARNLSNVIKSTGIISLDIDNCKNYEETFSKIINDKYTFSAFRSPSGNGIKVLIKANFNISTFLFSFCALEKYYKRRHGIIIDTVCKDITRLIFVSSDSNIYINLLSEIFTDQLEPFIQPKPVFKPSAFFINSNYTEKIINKIKSSHIDITSSYNDWIKIAYSLVSEFGINGINYFIEISQFYPKFSQTECEKVYRSCYRSGSKSVSIKSLYKIAAWHGINYSD